LEYIFERSRGVPLSFPSFPELPDDDPLVALRSLRSYVRDLVMVVPVQLLFVSVIAALILLFALGCLLVGADGSLSWAVDLVPFTFAVISVFVSVKKLRDEHHNVVIAFVLFLGLAGTVVIHYAKVRADAQHQRQLDTLGNKVDSVDKRNSQLLDIVLKKPELTEAERREGIRKALLNKYILTHDNVSAGLLSGIESPPAEWMNKQLAELGEKWKVSEAPKTSPSPSIQVVQTEKSGVVFSFVPVHTYDFPIVQTTLPLTNGAVEVTLSFEAKEHMAKSLSIWLRLCTGCVYGREPAGFQNLKADDPTERTLKVGDFLPGSLFAPTINFTVIPPASTRGFVMGLFYGCENCDVTDGNKPQNLTVIKQ
jgi:hypothetical protein